MGQREPEREKDKKRVFSVNEKGEQDDSHGIDGEKIRCEVYQEVGFRELDLPAASSRGDSPHSPPEEEGPEGMGELVAECVREREAVAKHVKRAEGEGACKEAEALIGCV